jgi:hypothetical protein
LVDKLNPKTTGGKGLLKSLFAGNLGGLDKNFKGKLIEQSKGLNYQNNIIKVIL